jgi:hypothetical protein
MGAAAATSESGASAQLLSACSCTSSAVEDWDADSELGTCCKSGAAGGDDGALQRGGDGEDLGGGEGNGTVGTSGGDPLTALQLLEQ